MPRILPAYAISIAVAEVNQGRIATINDVELGFVYNLANGNYFEAEKGKGCKLNNEKVKPSDNVKINNMTLGGFTKSGFNATLTFMQPLYAGGRITTGNKLAKAGIKAAELKHEVNLREKREEIEKSYWEIVALTPCQAELTPRKVSIERSLNKGFLAVVANANI